MNWTEDYETLLDKIRINSVYLNKGHQTNYFYYKKLSKYFTIPTIILSSFNSVFSVGFSYTNQENISSISALISLLVSIINSIQLYLKIEDNMEIENQKSKEYYQLSSDIYKILELDREHRNSNPDEILKIYYDKYIELLNQSNLMNTNYTDKLLILPKQKSVFDKFKKQQENSSSSSSSISSENSPKITLSPINKKYQENFEEQI